MPDNFFADLPPLKVISSNGRYITIDLSVNNIALTKLQTAEDFEKYVNEFLLLNDATVAYGGYNENRNLYKRSDIFGSEGEPRDIHIGLDLWIKAGTPVLAALEGTVHSFNFNSGLGNYGPTVILEHKLGGRSFYTLYGHLSVETIQSLKIGDLLKTGQQLGTLGDASVNGDYAPHLHFQVIKNLNGWFGDYPGVCSKTDRKCYLENCPDPNLLLKLN